MHSNDQHFLVIGTIEDADASALGKAARSAPEEIMFKLLGARLFEAENLAALRIDAGHHVPDGAVFTRRVHALKDQQQRVTVGGKVKLLQRVQLMNVFLEKCLILLRRLAIAIYDRRPLVEVDFHPGRYAEIL